MKIRALIITEKSPHSAMDIAPLQTCVIKSYNENIVPMKIKKLRNVKQTIIKKNLKLQKIPEN